jgi:prepilin-type N-terminal cleavage/methylation domain-containing protein
VRPAATGHRRGLTVYRRAQAGWAGCGPRLARARAPARGFTLVELVLVMTLLGVISALAVPRLLSGAGGGLQERAAFDEVRALLRSSRQVATTREREVCVLVSAAQVSAVYTSAAGCDPTQTVLGAGGQGALRVLAPQGMAFTGSAIVRFTARGALTPLVDGRINLGPRQWLINAATGTVS